MRGGYRNGAGRKKGFSAKSAEEARRILSEMVMREINPIGEALITKAKNGEIPAIKELFDRTWGRAPQSINLDAYFEEEKILTPEDKGAASKLADEYEDKLRALIVGR